MINMQLASEVKPTVTTDEMDAVIDLYHSKPKNVLGKHKVGKIWAIRAYIPEAKRVFVVDSIDWNIQYEMSLIYRDCFYEAHFTDLPLDFVYLLRVEYNDGNENTYYDHYQFDGIFTDFDTQLFSEGNHHRIYEKMGAHIIEKRGIKGVNFAVWAPNAKRISILSDFNFWDGRHHMLSKTSENGIWELFIPNIEQGFKYKYEISTNNDCLMQKADPYGFYHEVRPKSASIVWSVDNYSWQDKEYMEKRPLRDIHREPVLIYEVHLGSWKKTANNEWLTYRELADQLVDYVKDMGYTHIELLPVAEHPHDGSWGYQIVGYFAATSRFGVPEDFQYFIDKCHANNIGVIVDWVPAHFPKDGHGLPYFDGTHLYEHMDNRKGEHPDWGTLIFNYGRNEVRNFLISNALFWFDKYHIDGIRVDAVASMLYLDYSRKEGEWIPNEYGGRENLEAINFLKQLNTVLFKYYPGIISCAEESTAWPGVSHSIYVGGLGFNLKWNMGWMHDFLEYMTKDPLYRKYHQELITFSMLYAFHEKFILVLSHDEVVHGKRSIIDKMPGDLWQKFANVRAFMLFMNAYPGKKLHFMGLEIGQWNEWYHNVSLDWHLLDFNENKNLQYFIKDINSLYKNEPALWEVDYDWHGFEWLDFKDADNCTVSFIRRGNDPSNYLVCIFNFTPVVRENYRVGVPEHRYYKEIVNSDSVFYGGSGAGNKGGLVSESIPVHDRSYSLNLTLPPLGGIILKPN